MEILTINVGSTSLKLERYLLASGEHPIVPAPTPQSSREVAWSQAPAMLQDFLREGVDAVAHRFVQVPPQAGAVFPLDTKRLNELARYTEDDPLHNTPALKAVEYIKDLAPALPQYAIADGAFHRTMPDVATTYALPKPLRARGFRRLGYHGLSHEYALHAGCAAAKADVQHARVITAHLGGGSSLCAIRDGKSLETTMGFTPLEGLPMATRSGSIDPGILLHLLRTGTTSQELTHLLEHESGLLGISGKSGDVRVLLEEEKDPDVRLALDVLAWRVRAAIGAFIATLGGLDLLVFTGGVGEHAHQIRAEILVGGLGFGLFLDEEKNRTLSEGVIHSRHSSVPICIIHAREGWQMARSVAQAVQS